MITLLDLEKKQIEHDKEYHRDIFFLNYQDRFKHMVMHYGKYSGRLACLLNNDSNLIIHKTIKCTIVDCFIIVLSCADLLHLNLEKKLKKKLGIEKKISLKELCSEVKEISAELYSILSEGNENNRILNLMLQYTPIVGNLLKVGEDLDHMVGFNLDSIRENTLNILIILLLSSIIWNIDLENEVDKRWKELIKRTEMQGPQ